MKRVLPFAAATALMLAASGCHRSSAQATSPLGDRGRCGAYSGLPENWGKDPHAGMVHVEGGSFDLGSERGYADERPLRHSRVESFWIDRTEVTNAEFASFVDATGYVTEAEFHTGAAVFRKPDPGVPVAEGSWWHLVAGADWRHPEGPGSNIDGRGHEPVVDVTYADAQAYAKWLGRSLPSEAQWEYAAKAGLPNDLSDSALRDAQGHPQANFWQGHFPFEDSGEDGYSGRAPVGCYAPNPWGLQDMVGNVWEWTTDIGQSDPGGSEQVPVLTGVASPRHIIKGGSFLCSADYCVRARAASRQAQEVDLPASHLGFRTLSAG
jgi:formylglycine-generating enzyme